MDRRNPFEAPQRIEKRLADICIYVKALVLFVLEVTTSALIVFCIDVGLYLFFDSTIGFDTSSLKPGGVSIVIVFVIKLAAAWCVVRFGLGKRIATFRIVLALFPSIAIYVFFRLLYAFVMW